MNSSEQKGRPKMADNAIENAMNRRDAAIAKVKALELDLQNARTELERVDAFIQQWHEFAGTPILERSVAVVHYPQPRVAHIRNSKKEEVAEAAYEIVREYGRPMPRADLYEQLIARGMVLNGSDPQMVLSTMLWRMPNRIKRLKKGGYWLVDQPYKKEFYSADPESDDILDSVDDAPPVVADTGEDE
jgi:hypothetical protein